MDIFMQSAFDVVSNFITYQPRFYSCRTICSHKPECTRRPPSHIIDMGAEKVQSYRLSFNLGRTGIRIKIKERCIEKLKKMEVKNGLFRRNYSNFETDLSTCVISSPHVEQLVSCNKESDFNKPIWPDNLAMCLHNITLSLQSNKARRISQSLYYY